jgi:hypothetical protein
MPEAQEPDVPSLPEAQEPDVPSLLGAATPESTELGISLGTAWVALFVGGCIFFYFRGLPPSSMATAL